MSRQFHLNQAQRLANLTRERAAVWYTAKFDTYSVCSNNRLLEDTRWYPDAEIIARIDPEPRCSHFPTSCTTCEETDTIGCCKVY